MDKGEGLENWQNCADILYGWPLSMLSRSFVIGGIATLTVNTIWPNLLIGNSRLQIGFSCSALVLVVCH